MLYAEKKFQNTELYTIQFIVKKSSQSQYKIKLRNLGFDSH